MLLGTLLQELLLKPKEFQQIKERKIILSHSSDHVNSQTAKLQRVKQIKILPGRNRRSGAKLSFVSLLFKEEPQLK